MLLWLLFYRPFFHSIRTAHKHIFIYIRNLISQHVLCIVQTKTNAHWSALAIRDLNQDNGKATVFGDMSVRDEWWKEKMLSPKNHFRYLLCKRLCFALTQTSTLPPSMHRPNSVLFIQLIWEIINEKYKAKKCSYRQPTDWIAKEPISYVFVFVSSRQIFWRKKKNTNISKIALIKAS